MEPDFQTIGSLISGGGIIALCALLYRLFDRHLSRVEKFFGSLDEKLAILIDRVEREPTPVRGVPTAYSRHKRPPSEPSQR